MMNKNVGNLEKSKGNGLSNKEEGIQNFRFQPTQFVRIFSGEFRKKSPVS